MHLLNDVGGYKRHRIAKVVSLCGSSSAKPHGRGLNEIFLEVIYFSLFSIAGVSLRKSAKNLK